MLKKLREKTGAIVLVPVLILFGSVAVAAIVLRPSHIIRRSVEKCEADGLRDSKAACEQWVDSMTQDQRIELIRDI